MTGKKCKRIQTIYGIFLSILLSLTAILLIVSCINIYRTGDSPFSRESVAQAFAKIAPFVYISVIAVIGAGVLSFFCHSEVRLKAAPNLEETIERLTVRLGSSLPESSAQKINKERTLRHRIALILPIPYLIATVFAVVYALDPQNLPTGSTAINGAIVKLALVVCGYYLLPFLCTFISYFLLNASRKRELALLKDALKGAPQATSPIKAQRSIRTRIDVFFSKASTKTIIRSSVLLIGCVLLIIGIFNGGAKDVVQKAIKICRECIGLG